VQVVLEEQAAQLVNEQALQVEPERYEPELQERRAWIEIVQALRKSDRKVTMKIAAFIIFQKKVIWMY